MSGFDEAVAWFRENPDDVEMLATGGSTLAGSRHAAVIVRRVVEHATPADEPRKDDPDTWSEVDDARKSREGLIGERNAMRRAWKHEQERRETAVREFARSATPADEPREDDHRAELAATFWDEDVLAEIRAARSVSPDAAPATTADAPTDGQAPADDTAAPDRGDQ